MKKMFSLKNILICVGLLITIYISASVILPYITTTIAAYQANKVWSELEKDIKTDSITKFPNPRGYVNDFEGVFTSEQWIKLDKKLGAYELETTNEIAVVSINSIEPYENIRGYATDLANEWGVGKPEKNNGLLILFSKNLKKISISTGLGTEKILTDSICKNIIDNFIIPEFKKGNYHTGIDKGVTEITKKWK